MAFAGSTGMTLAETTAYTAGRIGRAVREERGRPVKGRWGRTLAGAPSSTGDAALGLPDVAGAIGCPQPAVRVRGHHGGGRTDELWKFTLAVAIGKTMRDLTLAFIGGWPWPGGWCEGTRRPGASRPGC